MIAAADRLSNFGEYYFSKKLEEIRQMNAAGEPVINLGIGSPDLEPNSSVTEALRLSANNPNNHGYQPYRSIPSLRAAMADFYDRNYDVKLNASSEILPLLGSKEGVMYISMAFLNPDDIVLVPNPGYPAYAAIAKMIGAQPVYYDLDADNDWSPNFDNIDDKTLAKAKIMWVNYPNMPTGAKGNDEMYQSIIDFGRKHNILICNDNPYSFILNDEPKSMLSFDAQLEHIIELNSLSKSHNMAGWRIGMLCGNETYINHVLTVKSNVDSGMFKPMQEAAVAALSLPNSWIEENNKVYKERKKYAIKLLNSIGCKCADNQVGMFVWAKAPKGKNVEAFIDEILQKSRVFITPGTVFGSNGEGYVRVSLCAPVAQFEKAMGRIEEKYRV